MLRACLRRRWNDGGRGTPVNPLPPQLLLLEVAPSAAPPARVV